MAQNFLSDIKFGDNIYIRLGDSTDPNGDLQIYHDGSYSYIDAIGTGDFRIRSSGAIALLSDSNEDMVLAVPNGAVSLYHNNSKKFETDTNGVEVIGGLGVGRYPSPIYGIYQEFNSTDANTDNKFAYFIDGNFSGADNTDGDREQGGIKIDIDSTADGDASDEHRLYGVWSDIRYSGYTDVTRGIYTYTENNNSTGSEVTAETTAMYASSVSDGTSATAGTNNLRGVYGQAVVQNGGYAFNSYGVFGLASLSTNRSVNTDAITGTRGEVAIDSTNSLTLTNARAMQAIVDINSTTPTITNSFLLYGGYEGDTSSITNKYGLYLLGSDNKNRLDGVTMFQPGTAAAPSITRLAETDTGIYFPATDTIGFTTGGTERARIASDGTITLSAYGAGYLKTDASGVISVDTSTIEDTLQTVTDRGASTTNAITINLSSEGTYFTGGSGGVRQLSITSGTNVSAHALHTFNIASTNGKYEFEINSTPQLTLDSSSATFAGEVFTEQYFETDSGQLLSLNEDSWSSNNQQHYVLYNGWRSGTGDYLLVKSSGNQSGNNGAILIADGGKVYFGKHANASIAVDSATAPLDTTYAYIGDTATYFSSDTTFASDVTISSDTPELLFTDTDNNVDAKLIANNGNLGIFADTNNERSSSTIYFNIDGDEKARFTSGGKLGIGTGANLDEKLHVEGSVNNDDIAIKIENTFDDDGASSAPAAALLFAAASNNGYIRLTGSPSDDAAQHNFEMGSTASSSFITFKPSGSTALTLDSSQNAAFEGKVQADSWFQGASSTNTLWSSTSTGVYLQTPGSTANNNDSKIYFRNHGTTVKHTFDTNNGDATFAGDVTVEGGHQKILVGAYSNYAAASDRLYIGGDGLASVDAAIYIGNRGNGTGYGYRIYYEGTGSGNDNKLILKSENLGSPVDMLSFTQDGKATFSNGIEVTGGSTGADIYINNTSPTLGFTDSNSFTDANDIYIVRGTSGDKLQFQWYDQSANTTTETFNIDSSGNATFAGTINAPDGSATTPAYNFTSHDGNGMYLEDYDASNNKEQVSIATDGSRRMRVNEAGVFAEGNFYAGGDFRSFASPWHATAGTSGAGFRFQNTHADTNNVVALDLSATGNATFAGDVTLGGTSSESRTLTLQTNSEKDSVINLKEGGATYGFSIGYYGVANDFIIKRHDNSTNGTDVFTLYRENNHASFAGNITTTGNLMPSADSTYNVGSSSVRWDNVYADNLYGIVDKLSVTANDTFTGTYSLLWHSGNVVYSSSFMTINGSNDTLSVPNISTGNATFTGNITLDDDTTESPYVGYIDNSGANSSDIEYRTYSTNGNFLITRTGNGGADIMLAGHATDHTSSTTTFAGNVSVGGNLTVTGNTTSVNVEDLNVEQGEITLNYAASSDTSSSANGAGIRIQDAVNATTDATMLWNTSTDRFDFSHGATFGNGGVIIGTSSIHLDSDGDYTVGGNLRFATGSGGNVDIEAGGTFAIKDYDDSTNLRFSVDTSNGDTTVGGNLYADNIAIASGDTIASLSIYADTHNTNVANISQIQMSYQHSGGVGEGFIKLTEDANNSFGADMTFGVPHNNGSGGSTTRTALTLDGGTLAATFAGAVSINAVNDAYNFKAFGQDADSWFGVYDDANNSANIILTRSDTAEMFKVMGHTGNTTIAGDLDVGNLRIVGDNDSADQGKAFIRSNGDYLVLNAADGEHVYLNWDSANGGSGNVYVSNYIYAKRLYDSNDTTYYVDPSDTGTSVKAAGKVEHKGLTMTDGTSVDQVKEYSMTFQLTANTWTDTGIDGTDLTTGTYAMQVLVDDYNVAGQHYSEYYSATISWYSASTNSAATDEIIVHRAGHAPNSGDVQFRTQRASNTDSHDLMLQVKHNLGHNAALDGTTAGKKMIFKFRRLI